MERSVKDNFNGKGWLEIATALGEQGDKSIFYFCFDMDGGTKEQESPFQFAN